MARIIAVAKTIPKPSEMAIGISWEACLEVSRIIGVSPPKVVRVVNIIRLHLLKAASWMASYAQRAPPYLWA